MDYSKIIKVLEITFPVFAVIGLGKFLAVRGFITESRAAFINELVFRYSLPSLVFVNIAAQRFSNMWNPGLVLPSIIAILIIIAVYMLLVKILKLQGGLAAAFVFCTFWGNSAYIGFPMSELAYGNEGISLAAVYNAYLLLLYIPAGFLLIAFYQRDEVDVSVIRRICGLFKNPIIQAALLGTVVAYFTEFFRDKVVSADGITTYPVSMAPFFQSVVKIIKSFLDLLSAIGLPMALIAIGAAMNLKSLTSRVLSMILVIFAKNIFLPAMTLLISYYLFPAIEKNTLGIAILISSMPDAVTGYVVAKQAGAEEGFVSSVLVLTTAVSIITVPCWLYMVL